MNITLFMIIINAVILLFMAIGFLKGMEGLKYTLVRFGFFILAIGLSLATMNLIADLIVNSRIFMGRSANEIFIDLISRVDFLSSMYNNSARMKEIFDQLPHVLVQQISFTIGFIIFSILGNIAYRILKVVVLKRLTWFDKGLKSDKSKKSGFFGRFKVSFRSKFFGGLMGMIFGFVVLVVLMMPVSGVIHTVSKITNVDTNQIYAESEQNNIIYDEELSDTYKVICDYMGAYRNTPLGAASGIGDLDIEFVKKTTAVKVDGKKVNLIDKVDKMNEIYGDILYLIDFQSKYNELSDIDNLNLTKVKNIINYMFENEFFDSLFDEVVDYTFKYIRQEVKLGTDLKEYVDKIYEEMKKETTPKQYVKKEVFNILDIAQVLLDSKISVDVESFIKDKDNRKTSLYNILDKMVEMNENNISYISDAVSKLKNSKTSNITACFIFNKVLDSLETTIKNKLPEENLSDNFIGRVSLDTDFDFTKLGECVDSIGRIVKELNDNNVKEGNLIYNILTLKTKDNEPLLTSLTTRVATTINNFLSLDTLKYKVDTNTTIMDNICKYVSKAKLISIINVEYLNEENIVSNEVAKINESINLFYASDEYKTITSDNFDKSELKTEIIKFLAGKTETVGNAKKIVTSLMSTKLLRNTEESLLIKFMDIINPTVQTFLGTENMPKINTENMFTNDEISKISDFAQISLEYYNNIYEKDRELIDCIVESNYVELGTILESMRNVELFKDYMGENGYYTTLMLGLDNKFGDYLDFKVATKSTFDWVETMNTYGDDLHSFLNYKINDGTTEVKMFDVVSGKTELTFTEALSQMGTEKVLDYYNKLKDCELLKPLSQILYNELSSLIPTI